MKEQQPSRNGEQCPPDLIEQLDALRYQMDCPFGEAREARLYREALESAHRRGWLIAAGSERLLWQPIETAPKTGMAETILLWVPQLHGTGGPVLAHWAHGGGEEQPRFGPAWFWWSGYDFRELASDHKPTHWMELPRCPADWRPPRQAERNSDA